MTKFTAHTLTTCVPISRSELFDDVTKSRNSDSDSRGLVDRLWIVSGHVFTSLENGHRLLTFDCKPVGQQHMGGYGNKTLDLTITDTVLLDILLTSAPTNAAFVVQQNGHVQFWQFTSSLQWSAVTEFDLCDMPGSSVTNVCLHLEHNMLFWCESINGMEATYRICRKALPEDILQLQKTVPASSVVLDRSPNCSVVPLHSGVILVPSNSKEQVRVCLFWKPSVMELVSIATIVGSSVRTQYDMRGPLSFSQVLHICLPDISQWRATDLPEDYGVKKDEDTGVVYLLHSDGQICRFHATNAEGDKKEPVSVDTMKISMPEKPLHTDNLSKAWSVHKNIIAIATSTNTVRFYNALEGNMIYEFALDEGTCLRSIAVVRSPAILVAMVTSAGVILIQGGKLTKKDSKQQVLPSDKYFQTDALQIAQLSQQRSETHGQEISDQLALLHNQRRGMQALRPRSHLFDTVDPYLEEFWRLEEQASKLGKSEPLPSPAVYNTTVLVEEAVARSRSMTSEATMSELVWLSQKYSSQMLHILIGDLDLEKVELTVEDHILWQSRIGLDTNDSISFELICRLLYQDRPQSLVPFVRNVQFVSEQAVGVSAFLRKKHKLLYYTRAMECLPEPSRSKHPREAAFANAQIILIGAAEQGSELALRFLLRHREWSEAVQLLRQLDKNSSQHISLFFLLLQHLIQGQVLSDYASEVFSLLSSWKSFLPALKVMSDSTEVQATMPSPGLFFSGPPDIPISALRTHLMSMLSEHKD